MAKRHDILQRPHFRPVWDEGMDRWTRSVIFKNYDRVLPLYDADDLYQQAWMVFKACESARLVDTQARFFALYKRATINAFFNLTRKMQRKAEWKQRDVSQPIDAVSEQHPSTGDGLVCLDLQGASDRVRRVLIQLGLLDYPGRRYIKEEPRRSNETMNVYLRRLAACRCGTCDMVGEIIEWITGEYKEVHAC
jgi:hypothetical protein